MGKQTRPFAVWQPRQEESGFPPVRASDVDAQGGIVSEGVKKRHVGCGVFVFHAMATSKRCARCE
ncbi:MAG: hypothetical protein JXR76_22215 [Deltaproteobacteria bacterium]|nr:hypothetical protein [Deltaproteobacteria bacterium]